VAFAEQGMSRLVYRALAVAIVASDDDSLNLIRLDEFGPAVVEPGRGVTR
jgi:hypothetical protein